MNKFRRATPAVELWMLRAVGSLQTSYRQVWEFTDVAEAGIAEAADILGITEANAMSLLRRARKNLRDALAPVMQRWASCEREVPLTARGLPVVPFSAR